MIESLNNHPETIRFQRPQLPPSAEIERYFAASREARWFSNEGPCHRLLSERLTHFLGDGVGLVLTANATLGLVLTLRALIGTKPRGSFVLVPSFTFPATAQAIAWNGLRPLWVDVEPEGWHLDPDALREALSANRSEVAGVLACSTFGTPPAHEQAAAWRDACSEAGVPLIVDSAPGFGARDQHGLLLGRQGDAEVFSFHATKPFAIGEGGAVTSADPALLARVAALTNFSLGADREISSTYGLNAKLSELHAAVGLAVLDRFPDVLDARRARAERIREQLEPAGYRFQAGARGSTWQFVPVLAPSPDVRDAVLARAHEQLVEIRTYHPPLHRLPVFSAGGGAPTTLTVTDELASRALSLPLSNDLSDGEVERIISLLVECANLPSRQAEIRA
jgi:dTDP-4-amino-4,6-dideoxygalactose transaminase